MSGATIEIEYELSMDDMVGACTALYYKKYNLKTTLIKIVTSNLKQMLIGLAIVFPVIFVLLFIQYNYDYLSVIHIILFPIWNSFFYSIIVAIFIISVVVSYAQVGCRSCLERTCKKNIFKLSKKNNPDSWFCNTKLSFSSEGVRSENKYQRMELFWPSFANIELLEGFFRCESLDGNTAFFIPSRFFKSEEEKQKIYEQCVKWWEAAQETPVAAQEGAV